MAIYALRGGEQDTIDPRDLENTSTPSSAWDELEDVLFDSVGLERVQYGMQCVQSEGLTGNGTSSQLTREFPQLNLQFQDLLVTIYFEYMHPLCPAINREGFLEWYENRNVLSLTGLEQLQLYAVFFGACGYLDDVQLCNSPFESVMESQQTLFRIVQTIYHALEDHTGDIVLIQTALILSHWSPYDATTEVNGFWVDEAMRHAIAGGYFVHGIAMHMRVVQWCCLVRNRTIVLGLHRSQLLYDLDSGPIPDLHDFELSSLPSASRIHRWCTTKAFVLLCHLSEIMADIVDSRTKLQWVPWWQDAEDMGQFSRLQDVMSLDQRLVAWRYDFDCFCRGIGDSLLVSNRHAYLNFLLILHLGTRNALWERLLFSWPRINPTCCALRNLSRFKIQELSSEIAVIVQRMSTSFKPEAIPPSLLAWIIVPIATHLIRAKTASGLEPTNNSHLASLIATVNHLKIRFQGAQFISEIINHICVAFSTQKSRQALLPSQRSYQYAKALPCEAEDQLLIETLKVIQDALSKESIREYGRA